MSMHAQAPFLPVPRWPQHAQRRLRVSMLLSTICIATILTVIRLPVAHQAPPMAALLVRILVDEVLPVVEPELNEVAEEAPDEQLMPKSPAPLDTQTPQEAAAQQDWYGEIPAAATATLDKVPKDYSVNPVFDEKRRRAAERFYPSRAPVPKPIWENVEKDSLGRSVLWSGDCYRVIDDPNVGSREAFETFGQYITFCMNRKESPKELPWVEEFRSRRAARARSAPPAAE